LKRNKDEFAGLPVKQQMGVLFEYFMKTPPIYQTFEDFLVGSGISISIVYKEESKNK